MKRSLPAFVYPQTVKGRVYYYFRKDGRCIRVYPDKPGFHRIYADLVEDRSIVTTARNFAALIDHYYRSKKFAGLAPRTQKDYRRHLEAIRAKMGQNNPATVQKHHVIKWRDQLEGRAASYFVQVMRIIMEHAKDIGWRTDNPCQRVSLPETTVKAAHLPWPAGVLDKWRAEAKPLPRLIMEIGLGTVQRPGDWTRFNWEDFDGAAIDMTQGKTGKRLLLPCTAHLLAVLQNRPKVMRIDGKTPIIAVRGKRLSYRRMSHIMLDERRRLGTEAHDLHALRYTGVMELARAGCDDAEIKSYSGHDTQKMVELYAGMARQEMRAKSAKKKRDGA